jgi:hypothetical protein
MTSHLQKAYGAYVELATSLHDKKLVDEGSSSTRYLRLLLLQSLSLLLVPPKKVLSLKVVEFF